MKRWFPLCLALLVGGWAFSKWHVPGGSTDRDQAISEFGRLPLVFNGRVQPFDSLARNSLTQIRGKQSANYEPWKGVFEKPKLATGTDWLLELMSIPELANTRKIFRIDHQELKGLFQLPVDPDKMHEDDGKHYAWSQLEPRLGEFQKIVRNIPKESSEQSVFQKASLKLYNALMLYMRLENTLQPMDGTNAVAELAAYQAAIPAGVAAFKARFSDRSFDTNALAETLNQAQRFMAMEGMEGPLVIPPAAEGEIWQRTGGAALAASIPAALLDHVIGRNPLEPSAAATLMGKIGQGQLNPAVGQFAAMTLAYREGRFSDLRKQIAKYRESLNSGLSKALIKTRREQAFNNWAPFYLSMEIYVLAFLLVGAFWLTLSETPRQVGWWLIFAGYIIHSSGLITRMVIEGRPPVTNLYSSAVFIGWGTVGLGLLLERIWRNGIGLAVGSVLGFVTLIIAHGLSKDGDTMEMMRAVLDTNLWLATHVVIVTLGYASTYVAGFLAILYVALGVVTRVVTPDMAKALARAVYGILCFATLFSFVGTVLGGIWADQSWGRFWGWDPKENGALIIVLWNALILHARWGGMVRDRGVMLLALVGNIVTSWSWFGTNMLGIGLHSYGFMDAAFIWLLAFVSSQLALIALGLVPQRLWLSWRSHTTKLPSTSRPSPGRGQPQPATS